LRGADIDIFSLEAKEDVNITQLSVYRSSTLHGTLSKN
jgi:hypothetical protein